MYEKVRVQGLDPFLIWVIQTTCLPCLLIAPAQTVGMGTLGPHSLSYLCITSAAGIISPQLFKICTYKLLSLAVAL